MSTPFRLLILGGTTEAFALANALATDETIVTISSLAGRVSNPILPQGEVRIGGFGGVQGLETYLCEQRVSAVLDATHPYAITISAHAATVCTQLGVPRISLVRPAWRPDPADRWHDVADMSEAAERAASIGGRIFVTVGRQELLPFSRYADPWFLIRTIEEPTCPLPPRHELLLRRGPFSLAAELELLRDRRIDVIVTKNSGGSATYAKIQAARTLSIPVVVVQRPPQPNAASIPSVGDALTWIHAVRTC